MKMELGMGKTARHVARAAVSAAVLAAVTVMAVPAPDVAGLGRVALGAGVYVAGIGEAGGDRNASAPAPAPAQVFRQWLPAALAGDAAAQYELGRVYADGAVTLEDLAEAARWYRQAASQGNARAQQDLAILYNKGAGVPQDYVQAYVWFDLAAVRFESGRRHDQAAEMRDMMAAFLTPEQLREAQRLSEEWQTERD
jgi:TPR repeat protein